MHRFISEHNILVMEHKLLLYFPEREDRLLIAVELDNR